ncbi:hypothetical protein PISMIDRAFT_678955 [Pisolithus microcarpus 441]|uniref:Uncharacterized protein n=1 Tax=Pisolithus microcarpus 441 TaxID=765257 RepID=A0A0C9ZCP3_9AGAM|nr:hypothetical protein PISMIDRAFT_678955 [Pisolithus microcarpus 441]
MTATKTISSSLLFERTLHVECNDPWIIRLLTFGRKGLHPSDSAALIRSVPVTKEMGTHKASHKELQPSMHKGWSSSYLFTVSRGSPEHVAVGIILCASPYPQRLPVICYPTLALQPSFCVGSYHSASFASKRYATEVLKPTLLF